MKHKLINFTIIGTACALGFGIFSSQTKLVKPVEAATHTENYDPYYYEGNYYNNLDKSGEEGLDGSFRKALGSYVFPKGWYTYGGGGSDHLSTQLQYADEDPNNPSNMIYLYTRESVKKNAASSWNREHCWPQSCSSGCWGTGNAGTDILHIRPTYNTTNSTRGNDRYGETGKNNPLTYQGMPFGYSSGSIFEPLDCVKGDVARIIMYVWATYYDYYHVSSLKITNAFTSYDTLLEWHMADVPDVLEGNRNDYCETSKQKNRNPFVDHPEFAWKIFGDSASAEVKNRCKQFYPENAEKRLTKIELSGQPTKKEYVSGQSFDPTGLTVTATYSDESSETLPNNICEWLPAKLRAGQTKVTCSYGGQTATYEGITVSPAPAPTIQGSYGICFRSDIEDNSFPIAANEVLNKCVPTNTLVESVNEATNIYAGEFGIRVDNQGSITFKLKDIAKTPNIESIYFVSQPVSKATEVDVKLNNEDISFESSDDMHVLHIAGYFDEGITTITLSTKEAFILSEFGINVKEVVPPPPSSSSSSEAPSSEQSSEPSSSSSTPGENKKSNGCNGSIVAVASLTSIGALIGSVLLLSKKRKK